LIATYQKAADIAREQHVPVLIHVKELTQPQGHSTSGSHERYKNSDRLAWESEFDCVVQMRNWMIESNIASESELDAIDENTKKEVLEGKKNAWNAYIAPMKQNQSELLSLLNTIAATSDNKVFIEKIITDLESIKEPSNKDILVAARKSLRLVINEPSKDNLSVWIQTK